MEILLVVFLTIASLSALMIMKKDYKYKNLPNFYGNWKKKGLILKVKHTTVLETWKVNKF